VCVCFDVTLCMCVRVCMCTGLCACLCVCVCVCDTQTHTHTHTHTHKHVNTHPSTHPNTNKHTKISPKETQTYAKPHKHTQTQKSGFFLVVFGLRAQAHGERFRSVQNLFFAPCTAFFARFARENDKFLRASVHGAPSALRANKIFSVLCTEERS